MLLLWLPLWLSVASLPMTPMDYPPADRLPSIQELPDPFLKPDGTRVRTRREWEAQRKHLRGLILRYEYGALPPVARNIVATEVASRSLSVAGAVEKELLLTMGPKRAVRTRLFLSLPAGDGPFPAIICGDLGWARKSPEIVAEVVGRGVALAEFSREEIASDNAERTGVYAAYPDYTGGRLAAWAWGFHRVADYLLTLPEIDKKRLIVTGHSRGGKAALLAGALDTRIALTAPNNSGCGGAGCYRLQAEKSEDIAAITQRFPYWFAPDFPQFIGKLDRLPFDQHTVKALVAPRALLSTEALGDAWANPKGSQQSWRAAQEAFAFLGVPDRNGIVFRSGEHQHNLDDWKVLLDFADQCLRGKSSARRFDALAFPDAERGYDWKAP